MPLPEALTTSDWIDYLDTLQTRDEKIAALATYHRRIEHAAAKKTLRDFADPQNPDVHEKVRAAADEAIKKIPPVEDYEPGDNRDRVRR